MIKLWCKIKIGEIWEVEEIIKCDAKKRRNTLINWGNDKAVMQNKIWGNGRNWGNDKMECKKKGEILW